MYATTADIAARWAGYDATEHETRAGVLIGDAEALILDRIPDLAGRIAAGIVSANTVKAVVCNVVSRVLRNPGGYRQESDGDYSYTYAPGANTPGEVALNRVDIASLQGRRRATTVAANDSALELVPTS